MSDLGFEVRASPERATSELSIDQLLETRFGDLDEADAAERGIHRLLGEVEYSEDGYADFESLLERSGMGPSADVDYQLALTGGVGFSGGCVGAAQRELFGEDPLDPTSLRERIAALATESTESAPEVLAAGNDWSSCVEAAGFPAQNPTDLMERYTARAPVPDQAERDAAIAGVRCYEQSGLIDVWLSVRSRTEQELAEKHALELAEIEQRRAAAAERAAVLLNGTGDSPSADGP